MANKVVIFPESKEAEARAYVAACDAHFAATFEPGGIFGYVRNDAFGQWVAPLYGPPWEFITGEPFAEPAECAALRVDGVLHDYAVWPEDE
ncbi:hypothetical protein M2360_000946 [Rhizobium sp. SG_E_25_P2]|uniref:hypothetical protein n=1 Tax=Rhizobium sp. SG_E_25_P2 TaxID=2879942 RepID=UPI0024735C78|nr:hypothetical protein [Rhizobium sp. SG_E_25_P2]MDH6265556.1 hypothetical protein [Rhizobium sp. SG_E_25_P2]